MWVWNCGNATKVDDCVNVFGTVGGTVGEWVSVVRAYAYMNVSVRAARVPCVRVCSRACL